MIHGDDIVKMLNGLEAVVTSEQVAVTSLEAVLWVPISFLGITFVILVLVAKLSGFAKMLVCVND